MNIYAIGDLHLSQDGSKSMDKFGWINHKEKIFSSWQENVKDEDIVIVAGDVSWALKLGEAKLDLAEINELNGLKLFVKGNHDLWWNSLKQLNQISETMIFLQHSCYETDEYVICGTRGWICPNDTIFTEDDEKIYKREAIRFEMALQAAQKTGKKIIAVTHYPPTNDNKDESVFTKLAKQYSVKEYIYGHLHGEGSFYTSLQGEYENINYHLVSCDFLKFNIKKII